MSFLCFFIFIGFVGLFIPLYLWNSALFRQYNPLVIQESFLPQWGMALIVGFTAWWGLRIERGDQVFFAAGVMLFAAVGAYFIRQAAAMGFHAALFDSGADISYFELAMPFLLISLAINMINSLPLGAERERRKN